MIIFYLIKWILILLVIFLCLAMLGNMFRARRILNISRIKEGFSSLKKKRIAVIAGTVCYLVLYCGSQYVASMLYPELMMKFNYEEAARGKNPNGTRFNVSDILSEKNLEEVIRRGNFSVTTAALAESLKLESVFDEDKILNLDEDISEEMLNLVIATEYRVVFEPTLYTAGIDAKTLLNLLADVYYENFLFDYSENNTILDLTLDELGEFDYLDTDNYLEKEARKLKHYIEMYSVENSNYRLAETGETFAALSEKIDNFINIELERYESFVLENGLSKDKDGFETQMNYENRILQVNYEKSMAAYDVRLEAIDIYDEQMARVVLVPTTDEALEFYMSRTQIGVDYFADEAEEALGTATSLQEEMDHNSYARDKVSASEADASVYEQADSMIEALKTELLTLSEQARELSNSYIQEKRQGYLEIGFADSSMISRTDMKSGVIFTMLFAVICSLYQVMHYVNKNGVRRQRLLKNEERGGNV